MQRTLSSMASQTFSLTSRKSLPNTSSLSIPHIHLGVYLTGGRETRQAVQYALEAGYRAFDSAQMYDNEREVGSTILAYLKEHPELKREDIHYTSKLAENERSYEAVRESIRESVRECGLGYIDLFLLHSPYGGKQARLNSWRALEDAVLEGEVRIPGVSNYGEKHVSSRSRVVKSYSFHTISHPKGEGKPKSLDTRTRKNPPSPPSLPFPSLTSIKRNTDRRAPLLLPPPPPRRQPNRTPPLQHPLLPSGLLRLARHRDRVLRAPRASLENGPPHDH